MDGYSGDISDEAGLYQLTVDGYSGDISDEAGLYQLTVDGYSGDAGNALMIGDDNLWVANGRRFTTPDNDNDAWSGVNCGSHHGGGWWFGQCSSSQLSTATPMWVEGAPAWDVQASRMFVKSNGEF